MKAFFILSVWLQIHLFLPIKQSESFELKITKIGSFGLYRKARPNVPAHYHTGIDILRPSKNYIDEPVFPIAEGRVISKRDDGPYAQIIIEHFQNGKEFWSVYEHIAGILVNTNDFVVPEKPIARFMNKEELNRYGWQFDHFHLEILKLKPRAILPDKKNPQRKFSSYTLFCFTREDLIKNFYDPLTFLKLNFTKKAKIR